MILVKNLNFGQKSQFWSKITILVKNHNFGQKYHFCQKYLHNFGKISQFWTKFIIFPNPNFDQKHNGGQKL